MVENDLFEIMNKKVTKINYFGLVINIHSFIQQFGTLVLNLAKMF